MHITPTVFPFNRLIDYEKLLLLANILVFMYIIDKSKIKYRSGQVQK